MINLSSMNLRRRPAVTRGLVSAVALVGSLAVAMPAAQAAQTGATAVQPTPGQLSTTARTPEAVTTPAAGRTTSAYTAASAWRAVRYNRLYSTPNVAASKCREPNIPLNTQFRIQAYSKIMLDCLGKPWPSIITRSGGKYVRPALIVHGFTSTNTKCGRAYAVNGFYCSYGSGMIYMYWPQTASFWKQNQAFARAYLTNTLAHEYGHHIQARVGILNASWWRTNHMSSTASKLLESRRRELQASCLGGAYIGANRAYYPMSGSIYTQWRYLIAHSGDMGGHPRDHGSFTSHNFWTMAGFSGRHAASCQTFAAAASKVS
jgi:predicted metalloprotease